MAPSLTQPAAHPNAKGGAAPALLVPFTRAAKEHYEQLADVSQILTASSTQLGPFDLPAYGFVRGVALQIDAAGGVGASTVVATEDAPWSVLQEVAILDVNGAPLVGPLGGYDLYLINKYGGYTFSTEPKQSPAFAAVAVGAAASGNFRFLLYIPIEVNGRDGLGALANQNAASTYKLRVTLAPSSSVYSTAPNTTLPTVRVRAHLQAWTQPPAADLRGNANATMPPAHGTTSYWSKTVVNLASGFNTVRLPRVGNYIRDLVFIFRDTGGSRANGQTNFPDPGAIYWDTRLLKSYSKGLWQHEMQRKTDYVAAYEAARGLDNGVFVEDYCHEFSGAVGWELRDGWLPTVQSTRLELTGSFGLAGALTILTNDVAPNGEVFV